MIVYTLDEFFILNKENCQKTLGVFTDLKTAHEAALHLASQWKKSEVAGHSRLDFWDTGTQAHLARWLYVPQTKQEFDSNKIERFFGPGIGEWYPVGEGVCVRRSPLIFSPERTSPLYLPLPDSLSCSGENVLAPTATFETDVAGLLREYLEKRDQCQYSDHVAHALYQDILKVGPRRVYLSPFYRYILESAWKRAGFLCYNRLASFPKEAFTRWCGAFLIEDPALPLNGCRYVLAEEHHTQVEEPVADAPVILQEMPRMKTDEHLTEDELRQRLNQLGADQQRFHVLFRQAHLSVPRVERGDIFKCLVSSTHRTAMLRGGLKLSRPIPLPVNAEMIIDGIPIEFSTTVSPWTFVFVFRTSKPELIWPANLCDAGDRDC